MSQSRSKTTDQDNGSGQRIKDVNGEIRIEHVHTSQHGYRYIMHTIQGKAS